MVMFDEDPEAKKVVSRVVVALALMAAVTNAVLIFAPNGWHTKSTHIWNFNVGLHDVDVDDKTLGSFVFKKLFYHVAKLVSNREKATRWSEKLQAALSPGGHTIENIKNQLCNIQMLLPVVNNCWMWTQMQYSGWMMLIGLACSSILLLTGAGLLLAKETRCIRMSAFALFCGASFVNVGCLAGYIALTWNFSTWLAELYLSHPGLTFGSITMVAVVTAFVTLLLPPMTFFCVGFPEKKSKFGEHDDYYGGSPPVDEYGNPLQPAGGGWDDPNQSSFYDPNMPPPGPDPYQDPYGGGAAPGPGTYQDPYASDPYAASNQGYIGGGGGQY
eukprot:gnl/MRDRNA2_/MRDRNA2_98509_c0_seq1.p1 gnl/MRDRNA2_/MRDRNA2_98509_c0~~gnl/MRDRNA2_/MRDRNA2_98509_c0_seq1.p1  ORF type:complete len:329 (+),score=52.98 gnl/MRDRNA2_/MRDRNA2_98509_c0_seq1:112-1098(+)